MEEFREIQGTNNMYFVSNFGRVRSMKTGIILKPFDRKGYLSVDFRINGIVKYVTIHKLVATAFLGPCSEGKQVNHKDMNKYNNYADNLEYVTCKENISHAWRNGCVARRGEDHGSAKLNNNMIKAIREMIKSGISQRKIAETYGVSRANISCIKRGISWGHV
jgi:hypothetical protein